MRPGRLVYTGMSTLNNLPLHRLSANQLMWYQVYGRPLQLRPPLSQLRRFLQGHPILRRGHRE